MEHLYDGVGGDEEKDDRAGLNDITRDDVFGDEEILENVSDVAIANYALEHKQVLKLIFARIVKEDRIK